MASFLDLSHVKIWKPELPGMESVIDQDPQKV